MNLIEQIQQTPKWKELEISFQKGVFEKFIYETSKEAIEVSDILGDECYYTYIGYDDHNKFDSFEELLIWYFNN